MEILELVRFALSSFAMMLILFAAVAAPQLRRTSQGKAIHYLLFVFALLAFTGSDFVRHGLEYPLVSIVNSFLTLTVIGGITYWIGSRAWARKILLG